MFEEQKNKNKIFIDRGFADFVMNSLGLGAVVDQLQSVGTALYSQLVALATQLVFAGQQMWQQAIPVFQNLVSELQNHAGNAVQLVSQAVLQLTAVMNNGRSLGKLKKKVFDYVMKKLTNKNIF